MMPYCTSYFKFLSAWFWGVTEQNKDFAIQNMGERGYHFVSIAHSISSLPLEMAPQVSGEAFGSSGEW